MPTTAAGAAAPPAAPEQGGVSPAKEPAPKRAKGAAAPAPAPAAPAAAVGKDAAAAAEAAAEAAAVEELRREALAAVRPATGEELEAVEEENWTAKGVQMRREAEALLDLGARLGSPELRARLGPRWAAVAAAVDRALGAALCRNAWSEDDGCWDGDSSLLREYLESRPADVAVLVKASLGSGGGMGKVGALESMLGMLASYGVPAAQLAEASAKLRGEMAASASTQRPPLSSRLSRFDASWAGPEPAPAGGEGASGGSGAAVAEARCEVAWDEQPSGGCVRAAGEHYAFVGGTGWKQRAPHLVVGRTSDSELRPAAINTGFYDSGGGVVIDSVRRLVWTAGGEDRIKAFDLEATGQEHRFTACRYTLESGGGVLGVLGGRVYAAAGARGRGGPVVKYWDIDRLTPQGEWIEAGALAECKDEDAERLYGRRVLNRLHDSMNDDAAEAEATAGDPPHGTIELLPGSPRYSLQQLLALGPQAEGGAEPQQVAAVFEGSCSLFIYDWPSARLSAMLMGHTSALTCASACPTLPHTVATGAYDATVRVWDLRSHACTHVLSSQSDAGVAAVALAEDQGLPFCFSSCRGDEAVLCWDLRAPGRCLYELATGNTDVCTLQWHGPSRSLFAATQCDYIDRLGGTHGYGGMGGFRWPRCKHGPSDFPQPWDAGEHLLIRYSFKEQPDLGALPPKPEEDPDDSDEYSGSEDDEDEDADEEDEGGERAARRAAWRPRGQQEECAIQ